MRKVLLAAAAVVLLIQTAAFSSDAGAAKGEKLLAVVVNVYGESISVKGYCVYMKNGEEVRKELEKDGAWGWNFRGDYIKEMKIQKVSGDAMYQVYVIEGDDFVFESKKTDSKEPVVYKRAE